MRWHAFADRDAMVGAVVAGAADALRAAQLAHGRAGLAVSGGRSPVPVFEALSRADVDWRRVDLSLVDERVVPRGDADSNAGLVRTHLLRGAASAAAFRELVDDPDQLQRCVDRANDTAGRLDFVLLGMGDDGHVASLFPDAPELDEALDPDLPRAYAVLTPGRAPHRRVSLTLAALLRAGRLALVIQGDAKRAVFEQAQRASTRQLPVSLLVHQNRVPLDVYWAA